MRSPPVVAIASSRDPSLGALAAPLDAEIRGETLEAVLGLALARDHSPRSLERVVGDGAWIVIKPNIVTSRSHRASSYWHDGTPHPGQVTDLRVIRRLLRYLCERTRPRRITIAEGPAEWRTTGSPRAPSGQVEDGWTVSWPEFEGLSYAGIAEEANRQHPGLVDLVDLNEDRVVEVAVPGALFRFRQEEREVERFGRGAMIPGTGIPLERHLVPETLLRADRFVSVAVLKTHGITGVSLGMKNYVGIRPTRPDLGTDKSDMHHGLLDAALVDLFSLRPADYAIVQGFHATEGNGPQWGTDLHHNVVVASADLVAADAVAASLMGFVASDVEHLVLAQRKRLGVADLGAIEVVGERIADVRRWFARATGRKGIGLLARGNRRWLVDGPGQGRQRIDSEERYLDLGARFPGAQPPWVRATVVAEADRDIEAMLWASADGPMRVSLGGRRVLDRGSMDPHGIGEHRVPVCLHRGANPLEVVVEPGHDAFGFTAFLCDEHGESIPGITYRLEEPGRDGA
jgi:uncharacterized protein (DUF362 family)